MPSDEELLQAMATGDRHALDALYRRHAGWLGGRLARATSSRDLAEEALQDAFLAVWKDPSSFRGEGDVAAWLWGIARRRLITLARKRIDIPADITAHDSSEEWEEHALASIDVGRVRAVVADLPKDQREVVERVVFADQPLVEVARCLNVPIGTLKSRLHRARLRIREEMGA